MTETTFHNDDIERETEAVSRSCNGEMRSWIALPVMRTGMLLSLPNCTLMRTPISLSHCTFSSCIHSSLRTATKKTFFTKTKATQSSPYQTLELDTSAGEDEIRASYRRLAKQYHPDVYDGNGDLEEGETAEGRFIKIQAAYELLMDREKRINYDKDNRVNPNKANAAWVEWMFKRKKAFDQRGDMAVAAWIEHQQRELNIRVRQLSRSKNDPDEERRVLARVRKASMENANSTMRRHNLVLKKRDLMRKRSEAERDNYLKKLLESEGLELDNNE